MSNPGKVVTANRLRDGVTVYLDAGGAWTPALAKAQVLTDETDQERLMAKAEKDIVQLVIVDPYLMDVAAAEGGPQPVSQRERIRARGPTIQYVFP